MRTCLSALFALALLIPVPSAGARAQTTGPVYIVQEGDTLWSISLRFGTSVDKIVATNNLANASTIFPGMELTIPGYEGVTGVLITREIGFGETAFSLSLKHGIPLETLVSLNRLVNPGRLYVGQSLILRDEADGSTGWQAIAVADGGGRLQIAAERGLNPWSVRDPSGLQPRLWATPGQLLWRAVENAATMAVAEPLTSVSVYPLPAVQGRALVVAAHVAGPASLKGRIGDWTLHFNVSADGSAVAMQGIHALAEPGFYELELDVQQADETGPIQRYTQPLLVQDGGYAREALDVPKDTIDPANTLPEDELVASLVSVVTPERLWQEAFQFPSSYFEKFPSVFGTRRSYNGSEYSYYHTGLDLYGSTLTPVLAPAPGRVVFAGPLTVRGNATYIDHGWGVFSGLLHQSEILVSEGDYVESGQTIGMVGGTGRVTGTHLHWEILVGGVPVDPIQWTTSVFP